MDPKGDMVYYMATKIRWEYFGRVKMKKTESWLILYIYGYLLNLSD